MSDIVIELVNNQGLAGPGVDFVLALLVADDGSLVITDDGEPVVLGGEE